MKVVTKSISVKSNGNCDILDITTDITRELSNSEIQNGIVDVFVKGSTAGITTVEYEPGLINDLKNAFAKNIPENINYEHNKRWGDGNGHAHVRASLLGASLVVPFNNTRLELGTWQQIVLIDFDNRPRSREIMLQIIGE